MEVFKFSIFLLCITHHKEYSSSSGSLLLGRYFICEDKDDFPIRLPARLYSCGTSPREWKYCTCSAKVREIGKWSSRKEAENPRQVGKETHEANHSLFVTTSSISQKLFHPTNPHVVVYKPFL